MDWSLSSDREFAVGSLVSLSGLVPIVNGAPVVERPTEVLDHDGNRLVLQFKGPALAGSTFQIEIMRERNDRCALRYWIEGWRDCHEPDS